MSTAIIRTSLLSLAICLVTAGCSQKYSDLNCGEIANVITSESKKASAAQANFEKEAKSADKIAMMKAQENLHNAEFQQKEKKCLQQPASET